MKNLQVLGINITICLILSLYLLYLTYLDYTNTTNKLPSLLRTLMGSFVIRLALMVLIAATALGYNNLGGLHVAVLMAAAYLLTMSMVHKDEITENFIERLTNPNEEKEHLENKYTAAEIAKAQNLCLANVKQCGDTNVDPEVEKACQLLNGTPTEEETNKAMGILTSTDDIGTKCKNGDPVKMDDNTPAFKPTDADRARNDATSTSNSGVPEKALNIAQAVGNCDAYYRDCAVKGQQPSQMCSDLLDKLGSLDIDATTVSDINISGKGKTCVGDESTKESFSNLASDAGPIGKAFLETMGGEPKCGPYASLDSAFNPQPFRSGDSVLASGAPDGLPAPGANFSSTPPGPYATSGVAREMGEA